MSLSQKRHVLVTGGCGFVGSAVVLNLVERGYRVTVLDDLSTGVRDNLSSVAAVHLCVGSIASRSGLSRALDGNTRVIHLAAEAYVPDSFERPADYRRANVEGSKAVLEESAAVGVKRVVVASTAEVYGDTYSGPISEDFATRPVSPYAETKLEMEELALATDSAGDTSVAVLRLFNSFGPRATHPYLIPEIIRQCVHGSEIRLGNLDAARDFCAVEDTAEGIVSALLVEGAGGQVINLGVGQARSVRQVVDDVQRIVGRSPTLVTDPDRVRERDIPKLEANAQRAAKVLRWRPRIPYEEAMRKTVDWYRDAGGCWPYEARG